MRDFPKEHWNIHHNNPTISTLSFLGRFGTSGSLLTTWEASITSNDSGRVRKSSVKLHVVYRLKINKQLTRGKQKNIYIYYIGFIRLISLYLIQIQGQQPTTTSCNFNVHLASPVIFLRSLGFRVGFWPPTGPSSHERPGMLGGKHQGRVPKLKGSEVPWSSPWG